MLDPTTAKDTLATVLDAVAADKRAALDALPMPVYTTDTDGTLTYWNPACTALAGREPDAARDRWCVTAQLYSTAGEPLPHSQSPMAEALHRQIPVHGQVAIAERPDGSRVAVQSYPTPLFDAAGSLTGGVNMLVDVTAAQTDALHAQADRCRRLASATYDRATCKTLGDMADSYQRAADRFGSPPKG